MQDGEPKLRPHLPKGTGTYGFASSIGIADCHGSRCPIGIVLGVLGVKGVHLRDRSEADSARRSRSRAAISCISGEDLSGGH